jgi:hypothetical protein
MALMEDHDLAEVPGGTRAGRQADHDTLGQHAQALAAVPGGSHAGGKAKGVI